MIQHLDEMRDYILIASKPLASDESQSDINPPQLLEENTAVNNSFITEELNDLVFKLRSYREISHDQRYAVGVEEGLSLAAEMLTRFIERHSSK